MRPRLVVPPDPTRPTAVPGAAHVVVVGGGLSGMVTATVLAERGVRVTVCEASDRLGGRLASWRHRLADGTETVVDHGFHAFFSSYLNLRAFLRRVDGAALRPVPSYPVVAAGRAPEELAAGRGPFAARLAAMLRRSSVLRLRDLRRADGRVAAALLSYDRARTYGAYDDVPASVLFDALELPAGVRRMYLDVVAGSAFDDPAVLSAAEFVSMTQHYFLGTGGGLRIETATQDYASWLWQPLHTRVVARRGQVRLGSAVHSVAPNGTRWRVVLGDAPAIDATHVVVATTVTAARALVQESPALAQQWPGLTRRIEAMAPAPGYAVARYWLRPDVMQHRPAFAVVGDRRVVDVVAQRHRFGDSAAEWSHRHRGAVLELQGYLRRPTTDDASLLLTDAARIWPELRTVQVVDTLCTTHGDASSFPAGSDRIRPDVVTEAPGLLLAGDWVRLPWPAALMERATTTALLAANAVLTGLGAAPEPVWSVRPRGPLAGTPFAAYPALNRPVAAPPPPPGP